MEFMKRVKNLSNSQNKAGTSARQTKKLVAKQRSQFFSYNWPLAIRQWTRGQEIKSTVRPFFVTE